MPLTMKLHNKLQQLRPDSESGMALVYALLILVIFLFATIMVTGITIQSANSTKTYSTQQNGRSVADLGMNAFIAGLNTSKGSDMLEKYAWKDSATAGAQEVAPANALCKNVRNVINVKQNQDMRWCVWTAKVATTDAISSYYVYSKGFDQANPSDGTTIRAIIEPFKVGSGIVDHETGEVKYNISYKSPFQFGITGTNEVTVIEGAKIYSHDFARSTSPSEANSVMTTLATDGVFNLPMSDLKVKNLSVPKGSDQATVCKEPNSRSCLTPNYLERAANTSYQPVFDDINKMCPKNVNEYPEWKASVDGPSLNPSGSGPYCFKSMTFDTQTTLPASYTKDRPLTVYVKGNISVKSGVNIARGVNPAALQVRSMGNINVVSDKALGTTPAHVNGYFLGNVCDTSEATEPMFLNGALACSSVKLGDKTTVYIDQASYRYGVEISLGGDNLWVQANIEQL